MNNKLAYVAVVAAFLGGVGHDLRTYLTPKKPEMICLRLFYDKEYVPTEVEIIDRSKNNEILFLDDREGRTILRSPDLERRLGVVTVDRVDRHVPNAQRYLDDNQRANSNVTPYSQTQEPLVVRLLYDSRVSSGPTLEIIDTLTGNVIVINDPNGMYRGPAGAEQKLGNIQVWRR